jgi:hypothetical protein
MNHEPPAELTAGQIRGILELRGMAVSGADLAALPPLATALRRQAAGLRRAAAGEHAPAGGGQDD